MFVDVDKKLALKITDDILTRMKSPKFSSFVGNLFDQGKKVSRFKLAPIKLPTKHGSLTISVEGATKLQMGDSRAIFGNAAFQLLSADPLVGSMRLDINLGAWWSFQEHPARARRLLYTIVLHELTHAVDAEVLSSTMKGKVPVNTHNSTFEEYLNSRAEVRARLSEMLMVLEEDFDEIVQNAKNFQGSPEGKVFKALKEQWPEDVLADYTLYSPKNKALVWKAFFGEIKILLQKRPQALLRKAFFGEIFSMLPQQLKVARSHLSVLFFYYNQIKEMNSQLEFIRKKALKEAKKEGLDLTLSDAGLDYLERETKRVMPIFRKNLLKSLRVLEAVELASDQELAAEVKLAGGRKIARGKLPNKLKQDLKDVKLVLQDFDNLQYTIELAELLVSYLNQLDKCYSMAGNAHNAIRAQKGALEPVAPALRNISKAVKDLAVAVETAWAQYILKEQKRSMRFSPFT